MRALHLDFSLRRGTLDLAFALSANPGEIVALIGPNGAGKTTVLRAIAGLEQIDSGEIRLGIDPWDDVAADVFVPPERRSVGMMFQDYVLFDHMSVLDNVAFPARSRGASKRESREVARAELALFDLSSVADSRPSALSGGQSQRVALARARVGSPEVLLLDEPFSALDTQRRPLLRRAVADHASDRVTIIVTHDAEDVDELANRVIRLG